MPVRQPATKNQPNVKRGEQLFSQVGCATCHIPSLKLSNSVFCDPNPLNPSKGGFATFNNTAQSYCFDLHVTSGLQGNMVQAYTDLKRHVICDANKPHYCNEPVGNLQPSDTGVPVPEDQFLTAKLWDVGNSAPWGHRGDLDTIFEAIVNHGGEATASEGQYEALSASDQSAVVAFLKTLVMPQISNNPNPQQAGTPHS